MHTAGDRVALVRRLRGYWRMEAGIAAALPLVLLYLSAREGEPLGLATLLAALPAVALLVAGALYWRAKLLALVAGRSAVSTIRWLDHLEPWLLMLTGIGALAAGAAWSGLLGASGLDRWAATATAVLAAGEYLNYYHVQLQHFDNRSDLRRLLSGKGLRRSHLRREIAALRLGEEIGRGSAWKAETPPPADERAQA